MRLRSLVLAFLLATGLAGAASKPAKAKKHAVSTPKATNHSKQGTKGVVHKAPKVTPRKVSTPKVVKHKTARVKPHKA
jgi:hypothetical protein